MSWPPAWWEETSLSPLGKSEDDSAPPVTKEPEPRPATGKPWVADSRSAWVRGLERVLRWFGVVE